MALLILLITCFVIILASSQPCQTPDDLVAATSPGHIIIGGLFDIHEKILSSEDYPRRPEIQKCVGFEISVFLQTLAMIHSTEMINNSTLLSGVKLGYEIYDTCTEVTMAMAAVLRFLSKFNCSREIVELKCDYSNYMPRVKAVIGAGYSEITIAVSRMLNLQLMPQRIQSKCSKECSPGQMKKTTRSQHICCYECVNCPENYYTNQTDMDHCLSCNNETHWAPEKSTMCFEKEVEYLNWNDSLAILLLALSLLGIMFVLTIGIIFTRNLNTPVVKSCGGLMVCYVMLFCHFLNFASTGFFVGEPQDFTCKTRQTLFGVSFTLCISCILMKSLKILLAFSFDQKLQNFLTCLYKPVPIVFTCTGIQVVICTLWLIFAAPAVENISLPRIIILECEEGSILAFGTMLCYIAILAFICFIFAFKGRKLPENYNETIFITFGMLIFFIAWITFIPVYATTFGKYLPTVEIIIILISNYVILCCTFFPKCYVILCKQETNTRSAFLQMIYSYSSHSAGSRVMSHASLDSTSSNIMTTHLSSSGEFAAWQKSRVLQTQTFALTHRENAASVSRSLPQKRISNI